MPITRGSCGCHFCPDSFESWGAVFSVLILPRLPRFYFSSYFVSMLGQNMEVSVFSARSVAANFGRRQRWTRSRLIFPVFRNPLLTCPQHYDAKHRFECPECNGEFTTESARDQVRPFWCHLPNADVILIKHYNAVHRWVDCPECGSSFWTQEAMNQVHTHPSLHQSHAYGCSAL